MISNFLWLFTIFFKITKAPLECSSKDAVETRLVEFTLTVWGKHVDLPLSSYSSLSLLLSLGYFITTQIFLTEYKKWLMVAHIWFSHLGRTFSPATLFCLNLFLTHLPDAFYHVQCHSPLPLRHLELHSLLLHKLGITRNKRPRSLKHTLAFLPVIISKSVTGLLLKGPLWIEWAKLQ